MSNKGKFKVKDKTSRSITVPVGRDRKIRTAQRTNQIAGFDTMPSWKKRVINNFVEETFYLHIFHRKLDKISHKMVYLQHRVFKCLTGCLFIFIVFICIHLLVRQNIIQSMKMYTVVSNYS